MVFVWNKKDLNDEQIDAIEHDGSVLLIACPGSGKTRALTYKIALELSRLESDRQWVVAITYTHRAAEEIEERIEGLGVDTERLWIGTIHSFCLDWILRPYAIYHDKLKFGFRVADQHETERHLEALCQGRMPLIRPFHCNYFFTSLGCQLEASNPFRKAQILGVLKDYWAVLEAERMIDFEMILSCAYDLIASEPSISILLSSIFKFVMVDEFQDTKEIQYAILAAILRAGAGQTCAFLVGDPNQAIYGSLGGYAMTHRDFTALCGLKLAEKSLSSNYRSSSRIVEYFSNYHMLATKIGAVGEDRDYESLVSFDQETTHHAVDDEIIRLIRYNCEQLGIAAREVCIVGPRWMQLAALTRRLMGALPEYSFDGPGMAPFSRDQENIWFKVARLALTEPSPKLYVRRTRWAMEILTELHHAGIPVRGLSDRELLRRCNGIQINEDDGLEYLRLFFDEFCLAVGFELRDSPTLAEHHETFFARSETQIARLEEAGVQGVSAIATFRRVFASRTGITISTIHGVKGAEFDTVIAFAMLEGMVPHFSDPDGETSARKLLYVVCSRPRKNLHLIAETGRRDGRGYPYRATDILGACIFGYDDVPEIA
ncbi:ATP-dependent helicase [Methylobacterium bullatum]|uniref:DNA 3'-5' helicase n=1 Tax=Methylobacterium bullatum TaxID=570505 RepID=A0AAV4Z288_9HYPH|nr:ATP-dependent helicase [Methylobacterium bullatum]MBD8902584.1 ATP-dependent DNA helicase [Methylobacterium bullatum]GJD38021.1 ATP-dependent DNA helicase Rep [Methylobacterium bullatum]